MFKPYTKSYVNIVVKQQDLCAFDFTITCVSQMSTYTPKYIFCKKIVHGFVIYEKWSLLVVT